MTEETEQMAYRNIDEWAFELSLKAQTLFREIGQNIRADSVEETCRDIAALAMNIAALKKMVYG